MSSIKRCFDEIRTVYPTLKALCSHLEIMWYLTCDILEFSLKQSLLRPATEEKKIKLKRMEISSEFWTLKKEKERD